MADKNLKGIEIGDDVYKIHYEDIVNAPAFTNSDTITWQQSGTTLKGNVNTDASFTANTIPVRDSSGRLYAQGSSIGSMESEPRALVTNELMTEYVDFKNQPTLYMHCVTLENETNGDYGIIKITFVSKQKAETTMPKLAEILEAKSYDSISLIPNLDNDEQYYCLIGLKNPIYEDECVKMQIKSLNIDYNSGTAVPENLECSFAQYTDNIVPLSQTILK